MTTAEKKAWLNRFRDTDAEINSLIRELEKWTAMLLRITPSYSAKTGLVSSDPHSDDAVYARIIELRDQIAGRIDELVKIRAEISAAIDALPTARQRALMRMRYIELMKWDDIAEALHYDIDGKKVFHLHGTALLKLDTERH